MVPQHLDLALLPLVLVLEPLLVELDPFHLVVRFLNGDLEGFFLPSLFPLFEFVINFELGLH